MKMLIKYKKCVELISYEYGINSGNKESVDKAKALAAEILKRYEK